ncbi:MAG: hypothetical protein AB7T59_18800 [Hyphomonadaceae bacterium]
MQVTKLRAKADGLIPAGAYFADIAAKLAAMNACEAARRNELDEEDRVLEAEYRKASPAYSPQAHPQHAFM